MTLDDSLRAAIRDSGKSLWAISLAAGVHYGELHRFMAREGSLPLSSADRICKIFNMKFTSPSYANCQQARIALQELPGQHSVQRNIQRANVV
jgi:hypothetical protein